MATSIQPARSETPRRLEILVFILCLMAALFVVGFPLYVIRPFRYQGQRELSLALALLRWAHWIVPAAVLLALFLAPRLWPSSSVASRPGWQRWWRRAGMVLALVLLGFCALASRMNMFEHMFHPISKLTFIPATEARLAPDDMVMAVSFGGQSHAYPIREMAYHHVVNDVVGGIPVVGTY